MKSLGVSVKVITRVKQISGVGGKIKTCGEAVIPLGLSGVVVCVRVLVIDGKVPFLLSNRVVRRLRKC